MSRRLCTLLSFLLVVGMIFCGCAPKRLPPRISAPEGRIESEPSARQLDETVGETTSDAGSAAPGRGSRAAALAYEQLGVSYRYGGASPAGFDCSGLVCYVFRQLGVPLPRTVREQVDAGSGVNRGSLLPGDLVFFNTSRGGASHVGIYLSDGTFIHAPSTGGCVRTDAMTDGYWHRRFVTARRIFTSP